jgi:Flp pilus assembly protein TadG
MQRFGARLIRFARDERGFMLVETVLMLPLLLWAFLALYAFWDAYRVMTLVQKSTYAVSDLISRVQAPVNTAFITGMGNAAEAMIDEELDVELRVTSVVWDDEDSRFEVQWSRTDNTGRSALSTTTLQSLVDQIPDMSDGDTVIVVETWVPYEPSLDVGVPDYTFSQFVVTRPRFAPQIVFQ